MGAPVDFCGSGAFIDGGGVELSADRAGAMRAAAAAAAAQAQAATTAAAADQAATASPMQAAVEEMGATVVLCKAILQDRLRDDALCTCPSPLAHLPAAAAATAAVTATRGSEQHGFNQEQSAAHTGLAFTGLVQMHAVASDAHYLRVSTGKLLHDAELLWKMGSAIVINVYAVDALQTAPEQEMANFKLLERWTLEFLPGFPQSSQKAVEASACHNILRSLLFYSKLTSWRLQSKSVLNDFVRVMVTSPLHKLEFCERDTFGFKAMPPILQENGVLQVSLEYSDVAPNLPAIVAKPLPMRGDIAALMVAKMRQEGGGVSSPSRSPSSPAGKTSAFSYGNISDPAVSGGATVATSSSTTTTTTAAAAAAAAVAATATATVSSGNGSGFISTPIAMRNHSSSSSNGHSPESNAGQELFGRALGSLSETPPRSAPISIPSRASSFGFGGAAGMGAGMPSSTAATAGGFGFVSPPPVGAHQAYARSRSNSLVSPPAARSCSRLSELPLTSPPASEWDARSDAPVVSPPGVVSPPNVALSRRGSWGSAAAMGSSGCSVGRSSPSSSSKLLGSYEESLLTGRMLNAPASSVKGFMLDIGASGSGMCPSHVKIPLVASFYHLPGETMPSPYVGVIDLDQALAHSSTPGRYRVPPAGLVQVILSNPERTGVKVFIVKYDFTDMPPEAKTFLRQRTYVDVVDKSPSSSRLPPTGRKRTVLRYAIHLRFMSTKRRHIYLCKDIRVVFAHRAPDEEQRVTTVTEGPSNPVYSPLSRTSPVSEDHHHSHHNGHQHQHHHHHHQHPQVHHHTHPHAVHCHQHHHPHHSNDQQQQHQQAVQRDDAAMSSATAVTTPVLPSPLLSPMSSSVSLLGFTRRSDSISKIQRRSTSPDMRADASKVVPSKDFSHTFSQSMDVNAMELDGFH